MRTRVTRAVLNQMKEILLAIFLAPLLCFAFITVDTSTSRLVDSGGRERIFHGVNVVYKASPYAPITDHFDFQYSFSLEDINLLKSLGVTTIRLGVMWPGVEPKRGVYNESYLAIMRRIVDWCAANDIYVLIDMHQDDFSEKFCGEGVPLWAAQPAWWAEGYLAFPEPRARPFPVDARGVPSPADCATLDWPDYYFTMAQASAVQNLYDNYDGLLDSWAAFWKKLASIWRDNTHVLGYELINEPWAGDVFEDPALLVPGIADYVNLQNAYSVINEQIRSVDENHIVFFEGVTWDDILVGFTDVPGGSTYRNRSVLAYHYYQPPEIWSPDETMRVRYEEARRLGCGWFCTETASVSGKPDSISGGPADRYFQSWLGWEYKAYVPMTGYNYGLWFPNGTLNLETISEYSRTYARAIAGHALDMSYNVSTRYFVLLYLVNTNCKLPTEIYANEKLHYEKGLKVVLTPRDAAKWVRVEPNLIHVILANETINSSKLTVEIFNNKNE